jgi:hypothetical protein
VIRTSTCFAVPALHGDGGDIAAIGTASGTARTSKTFTTW